MADRDVSVTLRAKIDQYLQAMKAASTATGKVATDAQQSLNKLGSSMQSAGRVMTLGITTPLVGLAGASVGMASNFESAFARMQGLAGVSASEIDSLKDSVLELAGTTAVGPQALAEGLYFLRSSGLDAGEAMEALEMSAMASAAGLGDTAVIADAVSSAMNAYAASNLSAAEATDILTATARAGKAEPEELAGALGRVLPIASELGITFEDVGGAIAALSLNGNDASTSATLLTNVMTKLLKPSVAGAEALADVGLSADSIRESLAEDGLLATLQMLQDRLGEAGFIKFMEDAQAVQGALSLVNDESGNVAAAFDNVADHAGATGEAFDAMSGTDAFKMKQALVDVQTAMVTLGAVLLPIVADIASGIAGLAGWFTDLPAPLQKVVMALGGVAAAAGPLLVVSGSLVRNWVTLSKTFSGSAGAMGTASKALGGLGVALALGAIAWQQMNDAEFSAVGHIDNASDALTTQTGLVYSAATAAGEATTAVDALAIAHTALSAAIAGAANDELNEAMSRLNVSATEYLDTLIMLQDEEANTAGVQRLLTNALDMSAAEAAEFFYLSSQGVTDLGRLADAAGVTEEELLAVTLAMQTANRFADSDEINEMALAYLDAQVELGGTAREALNAAEGIAGAREEAGNAVAVYEEFIRQLTLLDPAAAQAALELDVLGGAAEESGDAAGQAESEWDAFNDLFRNDDVGKWVDGIRMLNDEAKAFSAEKEHPFESWEDAIDALVGKIQNVTAEDPFQYWNEAAKASSSVIGDALAGMASDADDDLGSIEDDAYDAAASFAELRGEVDALKEAFLGFTDPADNAREATRNLYEEAEQTAEAFTHAAEEGLTLAEAFDVSTETGRANQEQLEEHRDAIYDHALAMMESGASAEEAAGHIAWNTDALRNNMLQAGYTEEEVDALIATYFRTPEDIETELKAIGLAQAAADIAAHKSRLGTIPQVRDTSINVIVKGYNTALSQLNELAANRYSTLTVTTYNTAGYVKRAAGGYRETPELAVWAEAGPEVMFPLTDPNRIQDLWADPRVSGPMTSALSGMSAVSASPPGGDTYVTQNVNVNMPPGANGDDVVRALKKWERHSGPIPISVR